MTPFEAIRELERGRSDAWIRRDKEALGRLLHHDYLEVNIFGRFSKQQVLEELFGRHQLLEYEVSEERNLELGEGACGLSYRVSETLRSDGKTQRFDCLVTSIYRNGGNGWRLALWQITPLAAGT